MAAEIPAGWYPNPWNDSEELYWSGAEWTGISRAVHRTPPTDSGMPVAASEIEESTVMRPFGAAGLSASAPSVAGELHPIEPHVEQSHPTRPYEPQPIADRSYASGPPPYAAPPAFAAPPAYDQPSSYVAPQEPMQQYASAPNPYAAPQPYSTIPQSFPSSPQSHAAPPPYTGVGAGIDAGAEPLNGPTTSAGFASPDSADAATIRWALSNAAPATSAANPRAKFGLVAMILGIVAAVFAIIPGLSFAAWIPAFVAIGLGIVAYLGGRPRGFALTGIIAGGASLAVGTAVSIWFLTQLGALAS